MPISIVDYPDRHAGAFERLNREWLEKYFRVEPIDAELMADPDNTVIRQGGVILYALSDDEAVGTVALKHWGDGVFELTKMAVTQDSQGKGLGRRLLQAAVQRFAELQGSKLYLESHSSLAPALALYESAGFRHEVPPDASEYDRADVYMVYRPE